MKGKLDAVPLLMGLALAGCTAAPIALSPTLAASTERVALTGVGLSQRGHFRIGASSGDYRRGSGAVSSGLPLSDVRLTRVGGILTFRVSGPDFAEPVTGRCEHRQGEIGTERLAITDDPFRYRCHFAHDGRPAFAELRLGAAPLAVGPLTAETRAGELRLGDDVLRVEPIHHSPRLALPAGDPLGYRLVGKGGDVGAVDVAGSPRVIFAPRAGPEREAALLTGIALSLAWIG